MSAAIEWVIFRIFFSSFNKVYTRFEIHKIRKQKYLPLKCTQHQIEFKIHMIESTKHKIDDITTQQIAKLNIELSCMTITYFCVHTHRRFDVVAILTLSLFFYIYIGKGLGSRATIDLMILIELVDWHWN